MSAFTESTLTKKLSELNSSQQSIQTLSLWLIHHRKHSQNIIKIWFKEMQKVPPVKKLTYLYLGNDVIQNSKKKGPEFGTEFGKVLAQVFKHVSQTCTDDKTFNSLDRILSIWEERGVYEAATIKEFYKNLHDYRKAAKDVPKEEKKPKKEPIKKRKTDEPSSSHSNGDHKKSKVSSTKGKSEVIEVNGKVETHIRLSPAAAVGDPPEPEELIKVLGELENSASGDASIREKIANLPPEVSELSLLSKLEDKESALKLAIKVNDALILLNDYNNRLADEMIERKRLTVMLKDFQREQQELLAQAEQRLEEYNTKLSKIKDVQKEVRNHFQNLPDLSMLALPDVTGGLAPLPSAGDLFNIHH